MPGSATFIAEFFFFFPDIDFHLENGDGCTLGPRTEGSSGKLME